jgi:hypothetical protein
MCFFYVKILVYFNISSILIYIHFQPWKFKYFCVSFELYV